MRILFVITGLGVGGAERQVVDLAVRLVGLGHEVRIAYLTGQALLRPADARVTLTGFGIDRSVRGFRRAWRGLRDELASFRPDIVHSHMVHANLLARLVRLTSAMPRLICTAHNSDEGGRIRMWLYRLTDGLADLSTNVSQEAVEAFEARGAVRRGRMTAVPNGVDTDRFRPADAAAGRLILRQETGIRDDDKVILAVGRLAEQKDYPNLLEAFARIHDERRGIHLVIVGSGLLQDALIAKATDLDLGGRVHFMGVRTEIPALLNAADVFVLSSAWEGFGLVVGEAMACGRVVVATDCGGVRELLGDGGFLVPARDPEALAAALDRALLLPADEAAELGTRARERIADRFSLTGVVGTWLDVYAGRPPLKS